MIATLTGTLRARDAGRLVVETAGVGYEVLVPLSTYYRLPPAGGTVALEIRQVVREDSLALYGFATLSEKHAFDLLLSIQHVGPKLALAILSVMSPEELVAAIAREDVERIDAVPGVGPKLAERVVRELRDKAPELRLIAPADGGGSGGAQAATRGANGGGRSGPLEDAISALVNLGYKPAEARHAVDSIASKGDGEGADLESLIRKSLSVLLGEK